jgi:MFS family permease
MNEWQRGWRILLGTTICSGLGMPLFYYVFSLFTVDLTREFGVTRGQLSNVQALLVIGALVAPIIGRLFDRFGFALIFSLCTLAVVGAHVAMATGVTTLMQFAIVAFIYGAAGVGCGPLGYTRPINAWFVDNRGMALGIAALGLALSTLVVAPLIAELIATQGWRAGFWALAFLAGALGLPLSLVLVRDAPPKHVTEPVDPVIDQLADRRFLYDRDFLLLVGSMICIAIPGAGLVSQISPLVQEEGIGPTMAALGVTGYAVGQVVGRIVAGWFLDRADPRRVAFLFTFVPALGFVMLAAADLPAWVAVVAVGLVGVQQGAEIDLFAYFTARRFGVARYGTIYGWIIAAAWVGNAAGIVGFGQLYDAFGNYQIAEAIAAGLLMLGAVLIAVVRINPPPNGFSHRIPAHPQ